MEKPGATTPQSFGQSTSAHEKSFIFPYNHKHMKLFILVCVAAELFLIPSTEDF